MTSLDQNTLFYGDNLKILREYIPDESVDLIYLDPPFNSHRNYNVLFKDESGQEMTSQIRAFEDTWHWVAATEEILYSLINHRAGEMLSNLCQFMGKNQMTAYLVMMTVRLIELHRVLKSTGSLYLHCDPTASHYLKIVLDCIFGVDNFRNEIIWQRTSAHSDSKTCGNSHDVIFLYSKTNRFLWVKQFQKYNDDYVKSHYRYKDKDDRFFRTDNLTAIGLSGGGYEYEWNGVTKIWRLPLHRMQEFHDKGKIRYTRSGAAELIRYLDEMPGMPLQDIWSDVPPINSQAKERLGYPTKNQLLYWSALSRRVLMKAIGF